MDFLLIVSPVLFMFCLSILYPYLSFPFFLYNMWFSGLLFIFILDESICFIILCAFVMLTSLFTVILSLRFVGLSRPKFNIKLFIIFLFIPYIVIREIITTCYSIPFGYFSKKVNKYTNHSITISRSFSRSGKIPHYYIRTKLNKEIVEFSLGNTPAIDFNNKYEIKAKADLTFKKVPYSTVYILTSYTIKNI